MDIKRLAATLGQPALDRVLRRVRRRLEQGGTTSGTLVLSAPTEDERRAVARLFGTRASRARSLTIDLQSLEALLREGELAPTLRDALESLGGPIPDLRARDAALQDRWNEVFTQCRLRVGTSPALNAWVDGIHSTGLLRRLSCQDPDRGQCLAEAATTVVSRLPQNLVPLAVFAATTVGDSHALDRGTPLGLLCVHAAAHLAGRELPRTPRARRDTWAAVGVVCDDLSAPVLTLNLPLGPPGCALDLASRAHAAEGEPYRVSLRQLVRHRPVLCPNAPRAVFVCENPAVVASAASNLGASSAPMLCIEGRPKSASLVLLAALRDAGVELRYHGDFDWPGVQITAAMIAEFGAVPWRMSAVDYGSHVRHGSTLRGRSVETPWDDRLSIDMTAAKRAVHEELVLTDLLQDLAPPIRLPR